MMKLLAPLLVLDVFILHAAAENSTADFAEGAHMSFMELKPVPATLVAVFSRRNGADRRALVRDMWLKVQYASRGNVSVKFVLCTAPDDLTEKIDKEHAVHGDILMLSCEEGSESAMLAVKTLAAMHAFRTKFPQKDLLMKVHDDSFVRWSRLSAFLLENASPLAYMGVLRGEEPVCRNASHPMFVQSRSFPFPNYPDSMTSTTGLILGRSLVDHLLDVPDKLLVPDEDRALGIWVNRLKKRHGVPVRYIQFDDATADEDHVTPLSRRHRTWGSYPYMVHHGLAGETIACLALAEEASTKGRSISECFKVQGLRRETRRAKVAPCTPGEVVRSNLLQRNGRGVLSTRASTRSKLIRTHSGNHAGWRLSPNATRTTNALKVTGLRQEIVEVKGSRVDWKTHRQRLTFVHIPKNGGTAIEQAGQAGGVWWPRKWLTFWHGLTMPDGSVCEKYHVPPQYLKAQNDHDWEVFDDPGTFCVVRDPYERAVSEYKYMLSVAWGRSMSQLYNTGLYDKPRCTADGLNHFLTRALQNALSGKRFQHDCHMLPQSDFIWGKDGKQWCRHILRTENMETGFNDLMGRFNYPVRLNTTSSPHGKINNSTSTCHGISVKDLNLSTRRLLDALYNQDFQWLNYSKTQRDFTFMHVPRNMGNLVEAAAAKEQRATWPGKRKAFMQRVQMPDSSWCDKINAPLRHLDHDDAMLYRNKELFCISRHPYDRVLSVYNMIAGMRDRDRSEMLSYYNVPVGDSSTVCSRSGLASFVFNVINVMKAGRTFALDCHMAPQYLWMWGGGGEQVCEHIIRADHLPHQLDRLLTAKGFADVNVSHYMTYASKPKAACHMSRGDLTQDVRKAVDAFYAEDFVRLGYSNW